MLSGVRREFTISRCIQLVKCVTRQPLFFFIIFFHKHCPRFAKYMRSKKEGLNETDSDSAERSNRDEIVCLQMSVYFQTNFLNG